MEAGLELGATGDVTPASRRRGCLLGGAIGDALGAPVEFAASPAVTGPGEDFSITDDTQMTLFTAEGLIRAMVRFLDRGLVHGPSMVWRSYLRWLSTQGFDVEADVLDGWLIGNRELHRLRAPGNTCLSALRVGVMGSMERRINDSKGCGGVMRVAPVGLMDLGDPFTLACEMAALTHGHPSGYVAAGALAVMIAELMRGASLRAAVEAGLSAAQRIPESGEVVDALERVVDASGREGIPIESLGAGWVAEEALAIAVYCALTATDFTSGVLAAVNHAGDSDSTGAITGNLLGALLGEQVLPPEWLEHLPEREIIAEVADDIGRVQTFSSSGFGNDVTEDFWKKYPGW